MGRAPTYQGRPLPRPDEEIVDQGLGFDLGTVHDRRQVLRAFALGATALGLAACGNDQATRTPSASASSGIGAGGEIPDETAGPYPGDGSNGPDVLDQSGIVRTDIRSSFGTAKGKAAGVPMKLELTILDVAEDGIPFAGAAVYVWHCTRDGGYSLYSKGITGENYLRGVQIADENGMVKFTSIFPACYSGRWPHVHFEVYPGRPELDDAKNAIATSQVALPQEACDAVYATTGYTASIANLAQVTLATDNVFGDDSAARQTPTVTGDATTGYSVALTVRVDTTTATTGGSVPSGGAGPGGSAGPGGAPPSGPRPS